MKKRYLELDALRGIAALMVVLFHYTHAFGEKYGYLIKPWFDFEGGRFGVQLFFIISGFVIFLTLERTEDPSDFLVSRFSRLYPTYWAGIILTFSIVALCSLPGRQVDFKTALINLTMFQWYFNIRSVDGAYWTLALELSFYSMMFCLFVTNQLRRVELFSLGWLLIITGFTYLDRHQIIRIHYLLKSALNLEYGNLFIAGIMFYKIIHSRRTLHFLIISLTLLVEYYLHRDDVVVIAFCYAIFFLFALGYLSFITVRPLTFLGSISYCLYLIHQNIGYIVIRNLEFDGFATPFTIIIIPVVLAILLATLLHRYVENPALITIRNKWHEWKMRKRVPIASLS